MAKKRRIFGMLRAARSLEKQLVPLLLTMEDRDIVLEIGYHCEIGAPLGINQLYLLRIGSEGTIQRRLKRLRTLGIVVQERADEDRRGVRLSLDPEVQEAWKRVFACIK